MNAALSKWEPKFQTFAKEFGESPPNSMKIAIVTAMMPAADQDFIHASVDEKCKFLAVFDRIRSVISIIRWR